MLAWFNVCLVYPHAVLIEYSKTDSRVKCSYFREYTACECKVHLHVTSELHCNYGKVTRVKMVRIYTLTCRISLSQSQIFNIYLIVRFMYYTTCSWIHIFAKDIVITCTSVVI